MAKRSYIPLSVPLKERLRLKSRPGPNGCIDFIGAHGSIGYGYIWTDTGVMSAHKASYLVHNGPIPEGAHVLHRCDRPPCIAPDHLFLGDQASNIADCVEKGRQARGERQGHAKLTEAAVLAIRADIRSGRLVAEDFGIAPRTVAKIRDRETWKHV